MHDPSLYVLHAAWHDASLVLWAEHSGAPHPAQSATETVAVHPHAIDPLPAIRARSSWARSHEPEALQLEVRLPALSGTVLPSARLALALGHSTTHEAATLVLASATVPARVAPPGHTLSFLSEILDDSSSESGPRLVLADSLRFFASLADFARSLLAQQRFVPMLMQSASGELSGCWAPWLSDQANAARTAALLAAMPASARAAVDATNHQPWPIVDAFLREVINAECRRALMREDFEDAIRERNAAHDPHVAWLSGLLATNDDIPVLPQHRPDLAKRVRHWIGLLEDRGEGSAWRLCFKLAEPFMLDPTEETTDAEWQLTFHLESVDRPGLVIDADDVWILPGDSAVVHGVRVENPQELLLAELGRAVRLYPRLERALDEPKPTRMGLTTKQAYEFLREIKPILVEQGFSVKAPDWWDSPSARLGARLRLESSETDPFGASGGGGLTNAANPQLGLGALVKYRWDIAVGDTALTLHEFEQLAAKKTPLVRINGRWVEIRPEDLAAAMRFIRENPGGEMSVLEAMRLAYATDVKQSGIPIVGMEATGWLEGFLASDLQSRKLEAIDTPDTFHGTLRPYQARGVSWMYYMERLGFGLCLADDMGLGKTIQLLALLALERERAADATANVAKPGPTLLLVPMSVVGNWVHETRRFCPELRVLVHHGTGRFQGESLAIAAGEADLVITTYALANRDRAHLSTIPWHRVVLDEAQYIKNPTAKQTQAVRELQSPRRVALTGTPVENRLTELWSIMDFLNPGYLGTSGNFRQRFGVAVERFHDKVRSEQLRSLIRPFVLRRLKTDPNVVADLPDKVESREFGHLTAEQASLYESCVSRMLAEVEAAEGIQRRGLVLATLIKLKQICNHPSLVLKDHDPESPNPPDSQRSGKCIRLIEMLDEVVAEGDKSLIFTQFREMGHILAALLRHQFGRDVLFLHGGTTQAQRQNIIDTFQNDPNSSPFLILSLKAGGVGLNLTAATHVFHFDRWWNPAVENQATDRAYRIGQTRTVQVHKFVVQGTLEERIDQMIESKTALAEQIIGSGEQWLTELDSSQLRDLLTLRRDAIDDE
ncbi:MAG: DEAD/DEAH box helicase [Phycisphaerales bacterium]|nr:MAG: DEAD/DEAH box helicase [Phycisphaerales bacterium]